MYSNHITLPDEFGIGTNDTLIYFYSNNRASVKNKVVFTKNMFCLLQQGIKEVQTAEAKEVIDSKEILLLTGGSTLMTERLEENGKYEAILVFFGNKTLTDFCVKQGISAPTKPFTKSILKVAQDEFLNHYAQSLQLLRNQSNSQLDELKVQELLAYIRAKYPETFEQLIAKAFADTSELKLRQVVELNMDKGLTIEELAFLCHMSVSTFKRHFADIYGSSPQKYFSQLRMEQAKVLLSLQKKASEIYSELGYENLSAFSNEFKKHVGLSPTQFQNKIGLTEKAVERLA